MGKLVLIDSDILKEVLPFLSDRLDKSNFTLRTKIRNAISSEEEPLAQKVTGLCQNKKEPSGCQLHNLQCGYPQCDEKTI